MLTLKVKKIHEKAVLPTKAHSTDAGLDITCIDITTEVGEDAVITLVYHSGIAIEIPEGYVGLLFMRSSISKKSISLTNAVGVIDSGYTGEVMGKFKVNTTSIPAIYKPGEKFAQLIIMPIPTVNLEWAEELAESERGEGGYGSSDATGNEEPTVEPEQVA